PGGAAGAPSTPPEMLWGQSQVTVDGRAVTGISVSLQPGMKVNGRLVFEGAAAPTDLTRVRVALSPSSTGNGVDLAQNAPAQLDATGHFSITGVAPGRYTVRVQGGVQTFTLKSAMAGGRDALDFALEVKPNEDVADITLTMTNKTQELSGTLTDSQNQPATDYSVIVFSVDPQYWTPQSRRIMSVRPGTDGKFTIRTLPPGDYLMAAVTDVEPGSWFDPDFLQQLRPASARVTLIEGDKKTQDLRIGG
ncbi:MAG: carboxypeptidase-like regulatory domain-containing protein, partial [Acidobacteriota bacterium]